MLTLHLHAAYILPPSRRSNHAVSWSSKTLNGDKEVKVQKSTDWRLKNLLRVTRWRPQPRTKWDFHSKRRLVAK
ncbi:MAG: hypothetical protein AAF224_11205 [Pseudomonadota bacterium]